jgi:hypothetical protein
MDGWIAVLIFFYFLFFVIQSDGKRKKRFAIHCSP